MTQSLYYSSNAVSMTLTAGIASGDTTCNLSSTSGLPASFPFKMLLDWGAATQEVVYCTALAGAVATIQRGKDGTTAQAHAFGAVVVHGVSAEEYNNADLHRSLSAGVHGVTGSVVGTDDAQTLTNKTFTSPEVNGTWTVDSSGNLTSNNLSIGSATILRSTHSDALGASTYGAIFTAGTFTVPVACRVFLQATTGYNYTSGTAASVNACVQMSIDAPGFATYGPSGSTDMPSIYVGDGMVISYYWADVAAGSHTIYARNACASSTSPGFSMGSRIDIHVLAAKALPV